MLETSVWTKYTLAGKSEAYDESFLSLTDLPTCSYTRIFRIHHDRSSYLRSRRSAFELFARVLGYRTASMDERRFLPVSFSFPRDLLESRLRLEIVSTFPDLERVDDT
jgi:hypothetical protein